MRAIHGCNNDDVTSHFVHIISELRLTVMVVCSGATFSAKRFYGKIISRKFFEIFLGSSALTCAFGVWIRSQLA